MYKGTKGPSHRGRRQRYPRGTPSLQHRHKQPFRHRNGTKAYENKRLQRLRGTKHRIPFPFKNKATKTSSQTTPPQRQLPLPIFVKCSPRGQTFRRELCHPKRFQFSFRPSIPNKSSLKYHLLLTSFNLKTLKRTTNKTFKGKYKGSRRSPCPGHQSNHHHGVRRNRDLQR